MLKVNFLRRKFMKHFSLIKLLYQPKKEATSWKHYFSETQTDSYEVCFWPEGFPCGKESQLVKNLPAMHKTPVQSLGWEDPQRRKWQFTPVFLPGKSYRQRSLAGYKSMVAKELDTTWRWNNKLTKWVTVCGALKIESVTQEAFSNFHSYIIYG